MSSDRQPLSSFWAPRYWPTWFGMGVLRLICLLPHALSMGIGSLIGRAAHAVGGTRRAIVRRNIELCFPHLTAGERDALTKRHFLALGMSIIEMGLGRWGSDRLHMRLGHIEGMQHIDAAMKAGKGIILLSAHFTTLEIMGRVLEQEGPTFSAVYRKNRSAFITELQRTGRERSADETIEKRDIKKMIRRLRQGGVVWYAPDQSYDRKGAEVIEFFGVPSMHTTATSVLARLGKAVTLPFFPQRLADGRYKFRILPPLEDFPSGDNAEDTRKYVSVLEEHIRSCPEQYLWVHRKFKNLPDGYPELYSDLDALK
ncbi:MAG: lipid A biosynthesis lauroyl acyltransferase [Proteobacteria bacterium]|nr:lipid A biosynthesis lauroyl acyltransferase [Pseudomonadota bacterium]